MIECLLKHFVPNYREVKNPEVRESYGVLGGILGIVCNTFLFVLKLTIGVLANSIAVISDAFNNLSDMGSSVISVIGARVGGKRADSEHPYGHGRAEYISALIISFIIIFFGLELFKGSFVKIIRPEATEFSVITIAILTVSLPVKLWMYRYNKILGDKIQSPVLAAASKDSRNDAIATSVVLLTVIVAPYIPVPIDGIAGVGMSALIVKTGVDIAKDTINRLLGTAPDAELVSKIEAYLTESDGITGMHGLMIHDYGPGHMIASVHAEVDEKRGLTEVHNIIDRLENRISDELEVDIVIHCDPVPADTESKNQKV